MWSVGYYIANGSLLVCLIQLIYKIFWGFYLMGTTSREDAFFMSLNIVSGALIKVNKIRSYFFTNILFNCIKKYIR